jgi:tetratricopeptide (TPR) repeat protein
MWHFNRGLAYAAKGEVAAAKRERERFETATRKVPSDASMGVNPAHNILEIARHFLDGEVAYREGRIDDAVRELRQAVALEDRLRYMEPPEWIQPARHTLGAVLVDAKRYEEAEAVYREDLRIWPENGWSLQGLADCLRQRNVAEAADVQARFQKTWQRADVKIGTSCLCVAPRTS